MKGLLTIRMKKILLIMLMQMFMLTTGWSQQTWAHQKNPKKLPLCSKNDSAKPVELSRLKQWHNCWGKYKLSSNSKYKNGIYEGEFANGKYDGFGSYYFREESRGDWYVGSFREGRIEGTGTYYFSNGDKYTGNFLNGKKSGYGILYFKNSGQYAGEWISDQFHGQGKLIFPLGEVYDGNFEYGLRNGEGVMFFLDGSSFSGKFVSDERYGKGIEVMSDGTRVEGYWFKNKREDTVEFTNPDASIRH